MTHPDDEPIGAGTWLFDPAYPWREIPIDPSGPRGGEGNLLL